jgi:hemerythrin
LSLHIGIEEIDAQHAALFEHLVRLKRLCLNINRLPANEAEA